MAGPHPRTQDMTSMSTSAPPPSLPSLEELQARREQLGKELELLSDSFAKLREAQDLFVQNISTLTSLKAARPQHEVLIPLTNSVFAMAQLTNKDQVLVDIGTGYFVEKVRRVGASTVLTVSTVPVGAQGCGRLLRAKDQVSAGPAEHDRKHSWPKAGGTAGTRPGHPSPAPHRGHGRKVTSLDVLMITFI